MKLKMKKKVLPVFLSLMLSIGLMPTAAFAAEIQNGQAALTVNQSKVAFAGHEWWVIGNGTSGVYPQSGHITLFAVTNDFGDATFRIGNNDFFENSTQYSEDNRYYANNPEGMEAWTTPNEYAGSALQQEMEEIAGSIPEKEQQVISARDLTANADGIAGQDIFNQKMWALSKAEFETISNSSVYSYSANCWLRSPYSASECAVVLGGTSGATFLGGFVYNKNNPARPAFSLNLSNVLFTSAASTSGKPATVGSLADAGAPSGTVKFTMKDSGQQLELLATAAQSTQTGETLSFSYSDATTGINQYVSCVLMDDTGAVKYYGKLVDSSSNANGDLSVPLTGVVDGSYTLQIFSEEANRELYTDFCSEPVTMKVSVSSGKGTVSEFGGTILHEHNWTNTWSYNETSHWHECIASGCPIMDNSQKDGYAAHSYDQQVANDTYKASNATCTQVATYYYSCVCGAQGTVTFSTGEIDASNHTNLVKIEAKPATHMTVGNMEYWYCDGCGKYFGDEAGMEGIAREDTVIPKLTEHTADGTGWHSNEKGHWNTCECGENLNEAAHSFEWVADKEATDAEKGSKHEECTACGYAKAAVEVPATGTGGDSENLSKPGMDVPQTGENSNIVLWIAVMLSVGAVLNSTALYRRKKKYNKL